ncbi:hypothetical protein D3P08_16635 [Paenibacillus nanensis]|uniref:DUF5666 domain-containing protein n=1 Tax=Paenibacillus nanensis TaxID=393251 RepID=A0A3A1UYU0_9BACL|nr:hypothetical protein [Paenibacillus nanensis]RIX51533.1 hypothetical protein D3P08_16635 [Paenibacillus nanensis]
MKKRYLFAAGLLVLALLAGCSNDKETQAADQGAAPPAEGGGQMQGGGPRGIGGGFGLTDEEGNIASLIGQVKSVSGNVITVYKSAFDPAEMAGMRGGPGAPGSDGGTPNGEGEMLPPADGAMPEGGGQPPSGAGQEGGAAQEPDGSTERASGGGLNAMNAFTEETAEITVTDTTVMHSASFGEDGIVMTDIHAAELKEGDVLTVWLKDGTQEARQIQLGGMGGFGGPGGNGGGLSAERQSNR